MKTHIRIDEKNIVCYQIAETKAEFIEELMNYLSYDVCDEATYKQAHHAQAVLHKELKEQRYILNIALPMLRGIVFDLFEKVPGTVNRLQETLKELYENQPTLSSAKDANVISLKL